MNRAFSLVELMVVVVMIAILVAMLMPIIHAAWDAAFTTQCQTNLGHIWKAINTRRAETGETAFVIGGSWPAYLAPYVDSSVFHCPLGMARDIGGGAGGEGSTSASSDGSSGGGSGSDVPAVDTRYTVSDLTFRICSRAGKPVDGINYYAGQYLGTAFADYDRAHGIEKWQNTDGSFHFGVDDRMFFLDHNMGSLDYKDMQFTLWLDGNRIDKMRFDDTDKEIRSGTTTYGGSYDSFRVETYLGEEKVSDDFYGDAQAKRIMDFGSQAAAFASAYASATSEERMRYIAEMPPKPFDYGLNRGTYYSMAGTPPQPTFVIAIDPRMPLIMDYGRSVVDYVAYEEGVSGETGNYDKVSLYFTDDEYEWMVARNYRKMLRPGESWTKYAALRHFGKANVLFCDGHIEAVGLEDLGKVAESPGLIEGTTIKNLSLRNVDKWWRHSGR